MRLSTVAASQSGEAGSLRTVSTERLMNSASLAYRVLSPHLYRALSSDNCLLASMYSSEQKNRFPVLATPSVKPYVQLGCTGSLYTSPLEERLTKSSAFRAEGSSAQKKSFSGHAFVVDASKSPANGPLSQACERGP